MLTAQATAETLVPTPTHFLPYQQQDESSRDSRENLCYHDLATYYVKIPHPTWGSVGRIYQRISPVDSGELLGMELRLHNAYHPDNTHDGEIILSVHRLENQWPGPAVESWIVQSDTMQNSVYNFDFSESTFHFEANEDFLLSLDFLPASPQDTIAIVTADTGTWTGHSFFILNDDISWWGDNDGVSFGDMHFCADVSWTNGPRPHLWIPWQDVDLGMFEAGEHKNLPLPLLNLGSQALGCQLIESTHHRHVAELSGPDSLLHPDTLFVNLTTRAPQTWIGDPQLDAEIHLRCNEPGDSLFQILLHSDVCNSDLLINDWNEWADSSAAWELTFTQFADTGQFVPNWAFYTGLKRPEPFVGHLASLPADSSTNVLALRDLWLNEGDLLSIRWSQYERRNEAGGLHALVWRNPVDNYWYVQNDINLNEVPFHGEEHYWHSVPWIEWGPAPSTGMHGLGLLYSASDGNEWFIDDIQLEFWQELEAPKLRVGFRGPDLLLEWDAVPGASQYRVTKNNQGLETTLATTTAISWIDHRALQTQDFQSYRVFSLRDTPESIPCPVSTAERVVDSVGPQGIERQVAPAPSSNLPQIHR